jgi:hypothetical protein
MSSGVTIGRFMHEYICEDQIMSEEVKDTGEWYIEGIFLQGDKLNNNKRVYPIKVLDSAVENFNNERISKNIAWGELGHPDSPKINLDKTAVLVTGLEKKGSDYWGKAKVCHEDCPMGKILRGLLKTGGRVGVSSRGLGSADPKPWEGGEECNLVNQFVMRAIDVVADPSAPDAMVESIQEEKEYILDGCSGKIYDMNEENYKMFESKLKNLPVKQERSQEQVFEAIKCFLGSLKGE